MVHSVYSERDIFLRELISNGADACEKLRHEALTKPELTGDFAGFQINIALDKDKRLLSVGDNGIGMSREELSTALGTIASSGTRAFLEKLGGEEKSAIAADLIGHFGIGFYSVFMVADKVEVDTRRAGTDEAWRWTSDGKGTYAIEPLPLEEAPARGTRVRLHIMESPEHRPRIFERHCRADCTDRGEGQGREGGGKRRAEENQRGQRALGAV
jgi:molecular chaperone HtpG